MPRRILKGSVVSDAADKTITVLVDRRIMHPVYGKFIRKTKKYSVHDPENKVKIGETVRIIERSPVSKTKKWEVLLKSSTE